MTTYGRAVFLDQAQAEIERHLVTSAGGRCHGCQQLEPCPTRDHLSRVFATYGALPRRRPGLTRAGLRAIVVRPGR